MTYPNTTPVNFLDASANARASSSPFVDIFQPRSPTPQDVTSATSINTYAIQQKWLNTANNTLWELKSFNSSNGVTTANWIKLGSASLTESLTGDSGGAVFPDINSNINVLGDGTFITTVGTPLTNTLTIEQIAGSVVASNEVDAHTGPGTNPVVPSASGVITVTGGQVAAGTTANVIQTDSLAANTYTIQVQRSQAVASSTVGDNGVCHFDSAMFSVDSNGFVEAGGTLATSYVENSGTAVPSGGVLNVLGNNGVTTSGSGNTITISGSGIFSFNYTNVTHADSTYTVLSTDEYISVDCSMGPVILDFPNAPPFKRTWVIKDRTGNCATNNITITTPGGTVTFDGQTSLVMDSDFMALQIIANATPTYEVF